MGTEEAWFIELSLYCVVLVIPILSLLAVVYGFREIAVRHRLFYKLVGLLLVLVGILGAIVTVTHILPAAAEGLSNIQSSIRPAPTPNNPFNGD